jgi:hypothetical protein
MFAGEEVLHAARELADTAAERRKYAKYLAWLSDNEPAQKQLKLESMSKDSALCGTAFRLPLGKEHPAKRGHSERREASMREARELLWLEALSAATAKLGKTVADVAREIKATPWAAAIAAHLKSASTVSNGWLEQTKFRCSRGR